MITLTRKTTIHSERTTDPTGYAINEGELADHLGVSDQNEARILNRYIDVATSVLATLAGQLLVSQSYTFIVDGNFNTIPVVLPYAPLASITSFKYYTLSDTEEDFDHASNLNLDLPRGRFWLKEGASWPTDLRGVVSYKIVAAMGYGTTIDTVPSELRMAVNFLVGWFWDHREAGSVPNIQEAINDPNVMQFIAPYLRGLV